MEHLIKINGDTGFLELDVGLLKNIFAKAETNPIAVITVCGATCASKKSIISEIQKGLVSKSTSEPNPDLSSSNKSHGIWIVAEPYIIPKCDKNLAVFVMFIQGPFDENFSPNDTSTLMMLAVLLSSVVVINIPSILPDDFVDILKQPLEFANLVKAKDPSVTPYQYLDIVISNWTTGGFIPGKKGGSKYLKEQLEEIILEAKADGMYSKLKSAFVKTHCFLLPNDSTAKHVKKFFDTICEKQLSPKLFVGNQVTVESFTYLCQELVAAYNKTSLPKPKDLFQTAVAVNIQCLVVRTFTTFLDVINNKSLSDEVIRKKAEVKANQMCKEGKIFNTNDECVQEFMKRVEDYLEKRGKKETEYVQSRVKGQDEQENSYQPERRYSKLDTECYEPVLNEMINKVMTDVIKKVGGDADSDKLLHAIASCAKKAKKQLDAKLDEEEDDNQIQLLTLKRWDEKVRELKNSFLTGSATTFYQSPASPSTSRDHNIDIDNLSLSSGVSSSYSMSSQSQKSHSYAPKQRIDSDDIAIGIDLGTTYCCMGVVINGGVKIIPNAIGKNTTPSYLVFLQSNECIIGEAAKKRNARSAETKLFNIKRIIGRSYSDAVLQSDIKTFPFTVVNEDDCPKIQVGDNTMHPEEISAKLLQNLVQDAEKYLQKKVTKAVITVPAYFNDTQRKATVNAGEMAGLTVLGIMTEPNAAAIAYNLDNIYGTARYFLVFDLGGGTFDVALFKSKGGIIECLAIDGDTHLGGEDFDLKMTDYCVEKCKQQTGIDFYAKRKSPNKRDQDEAHRKIKRIQGVCEKQKEDFCSAPETDIVVDALSDNYDMEITMSKVTFEELNKAYFEKTIEVVQRVLNAKQLTPEQINDVILIGGSAKITKIQDLLKKYFARANLNNTINPDEAVAYGAAVHAAALNAKRSFPEGDNVPQMEDEFMQQIVSMDVQDITPISYGIDTTDGKFSVIIPRYTKIPSSLTRMYTTAYDNAPMVAIEVFQGEHPISKQNINLGKFVIDGIPKRKAGAESVKVDMSIDNNGILVVTATVLSTMHVKKITVDSAKSMDIREKIMHVQQEIATDKFSRNDLTRRSERDDNYYLYADRMKNTYE